MKNLVILLFVSLYSLSASAIILWDYKDCNTKTKWCEQAIWETSAGSEFKLPFEDSTWWTSSDGTLHLLTRHEISDSSTLFIVAQSPLSTETATIGQTKITHGLCDITYEFTNPNDVLTLSKSIKSGDKFIRKYPSHGFNWAVELNFACTPSVCTVRFLGGEFGRIPSQGPVCKQH